MAEEILENTENTPIDNSSMEPLAIDQDPNVYQNPNHLGDEPTVAMFDDLNMPKTESMVHNVKMQGSDETVNPYINDYYKNIVDQTSKLELFDTSIFPPYNPPSLSKMGKISGSDEIDPSGFDRNTSQGRNNSFSSALQQGQRDVGANPTPGYQEPFHFSEKAFNMDRYHLHPNFADLGFNPLANNELLYQQSSSKSANWDRTMAAWSVNFWPAMTAQWRSWADFSRGRPFDSDFLGARAFQESMRIGGSGGEGGALSRKWWNDLFLQSSYTMGIVSSIAVEELVMWSAIAGLTYTTGVGGTLAVPKALKTGANLNKLRGLFSGLGRFADTAALGSSYKRIVNTYKTALSSLDDIRNAKNAWTGIRLTGQGLAKVGANFLAPETMYAMHRLRTRMKQGENITSLVKGAESLGGFYRDIRNINLALSESKMEAGMSEMTLRNNLYAQRREQLGLKDSTEELPQEIIDDIYRDAAAGGFKNLMINFPILWLSNKLVLGRITRGFRPVGELMDATLDGAMGRMQRTFMKPKDYAKAVGKGTVKEGFYDAGDYVFFNTIRKMYNAGAKGSVKHAAGVALRFGSMNLAEGIQEVLQESSALGLEQYYRDLYDSNSMADMEAQLAVINSAYDEGIRKSSRDWEKIGELIADGWNQSDVFAKYAKAGMHELGIEQGTSVFLSGFMMGGLIQGPQNLVMKGLPKVVNWAWDKTAYEKQEKAEKKYVDMVGESNQKLYADPIHFFDKKKFNVELQKVINQRMSQHTLGNNVREWMDDKDYGDFEHIYNSIKSGHYDSQVNNLEKIKGLDDQTVKTFFRAPNGNPVKLRKRLEDMVHRAKQIKINVEAIEKKFPNAFNPSNHTMGTEAYEQEALSWLGVDQTQKYLALAKDQMTQQLKRSVDIMESLAKDPVVAKSDPKDVQILTSQKTLDQEIEILRIETKEPAETKDQIERKKYKTKKLELLQKMQTILNNEKYVGAKGYFLKKHINKIKPTFLKYLNLIANKKDSFVNYENIDDTLFKIIDWGALKGHAGDFNQAIMTLSDPNRFYEIADRMRGIHQKVWEDMRDSNKIAARQYKNLKNKKRNLLVARLAERGVHMDKNQFREFMEKGTIPTMFYDRVGPVLPQGASAQLWLDIQELLTSFRMDLKKEKATTGEDVFTSEESTTEEGYKDFADIENIQPQTDKDEMSQVEKDILAETAKRDEFYKTHPETENLMREIYQKEYVEKYNEELDGPFLKYTFWKAKKANKGKGGKGILNARYELYKHYEKAQTDNPKTTGTFDDFINSSNNRKIVNKIMRANDVTIDLISRSKFDSPEFRDNLLDKSKDNERTKEAVKKSKFPGIFYIHTKTINSAGENVEYWQVVDKSKNDLSVRNKNLDEKSKRLNANGIYLSLSKAEDAADFINQNNPVEPFTVKLFGETYRTGELLEKNGKYWLNRTTKSSYNNNGSLYLVPLENVTEKIARNAKAAFPKTKNKIKEWKKVDISKDDKDVTQLSVKKLPVKSPIMFYAFDGGMVKYGRFAADNQLNERGGEEVQTRFQNWLTNLDSETRESLTILVERNPEYENYQKKLDNLKNDPDALEPFDQYNTFSTANENTELKTGQNEFEITLMDGKKPIAKLRNMGLVTLMDGNEVIKGSEITQEQAERLFNIKNEDDYLFIRNRYISLEAINKQIKDKLGDNEYIEIPFSDLKKTSLYLTPGTPLVRMQDPDSTTEKLIEADSKIDNLDYSTYDGHTVIADIYTTWEKGQPIQQVNWLIGPNATSKEQVKIRKEITEIVKQSKGKSEQDFFHISDIQLGRYVQFVKSPNGTVTWFKLKSEILTDERIQDIIVKIKERQAHTREKNYKGKEIKTNANKNINDAWNSELQTNDTEGFYLQNKAGDDINFSINYEGKLQVNYFNKRYESGASELGYQGRGNLWITPGEMGIVETVDEFIEMLNDRWAARQDYLEQQEAKEGRKYNKIKLKFTRESFANHIPQTTRVDKIKDLVTAKINKKIRGNKGLYIKFDDPSIKQAIANRDTSTPVEETTDSNITETVEEVDVTQDKVDIYYGTKDEQGRSKGVTLENYSEFKQSIDNHIIKKVKNGEKLSALEDFIWKNSLKAEYESRNKEDGKDTGAADKVQRIIELNQKLKKRRIELRTELSNKIKKENPNYSNKQINNEVDKLISENQELKDIANQIQTLTDQLNNANKIIRGNYNKEFEDDEERITKLEEFRAYVRDILPDGIVTVEEIDRIFDNLANEGRYTVGTFATDLVSVGGNLEFRGRIFTSEQAPYKYHEAFHAVFRLMLTAEQQRKFLNQSKKLLKADLKKQGKTLKQEMALYRLDSQMYAEMSDEALLDTMAEEWLADQFEKFKQNAKSSNAPAEVKNWFTKLIDFIKAIFERLSKSDIQLLFDKIDRGGFRDSKVDENNLFTKNVKFNVPQVALKLIREGQKIMTRPVKNNLGKIVDKPIIVTTYLPADVQNTLIASIADIYITNVENIEGEFIPEAILKDAIDEQIQLYNPQDEFFENMPFEQRSKIIDSVTERYDALLQNREDITAAVKEYLEFFDINVNDKLETLNDLEFDIASNVKNVDQYDVASDEIGGVKSLPSAMRKFIATTTVEVTDEFGRTVKQPVDFVDAYNAMLKAVKNTTNPTQIIKKLSMFREHSVHGRAVIDRIFTKIGLDGLTQEEINSSGWTLPTNAKGHFVVSNSNFFQGAIKAFTQFRLDYLFAEVDPATGQVHIFPANRKDDANSQIDKWSTAYTAMYNDLVNNTNDMHDYAIATWNTLRNEMNRDSIKDAELNETSQELSKDILEYTGINLNKGYIKYLILRNILNENRTDKQKDYLDLYKVNDDITAEDVDQIVKALGIVDSKTKKATPVLFDRITDARLSIEGVGEISGSSEMGVKLRLQKLARGNSIFDETVGTTVFRTPDGKLKYAHQMPTFHMERVEQLNTPEELNKMKRDPYYKDNFLLNSPKFNDIVKKGLLRIIRIAGHKHVMLQTNEEGDFVVSKALTINKKPGVAFGDSSGKDIMTQLLNVYFTNYQAKTGNVKSESYINEEGNVDNYVIAPVDIRIIEASSTGDLVGLPIEKTVESKEGGSVLTDEYIDHMLNEIRIEYETITREYNERYSNGKFESGRIEGYNIEENGKWRRLNKARELLTKRTKEIASRVREKAPHLNTTQKATLKSGSSIILKTTDGANRSNIVVGEKIVAPMVINKKSTNYTFENKGERTAMDYIEDLDGLINRFGNAISTEVKMKYSFTYGDEKTKYYTNDGMIWKFFNSLNKKEQASYYIFEVKPVEETEIGLTQEDVKVYETDDLAAQRLEEYATTINPDTNKLYTFDEAIAKINKEDINTKSIINDRLMLMYSEFETLVDELGMDSLNKAITEQLKNSNQKVTEQTETSMNQLFLLKNNKNHNLKQIFFNDYLNTKSFNQLLLGNTAMTLKDAIDEIKRAKMQNAAGPSAESIIISPYEYDAEGNIIGGYGIDHPNKHISMIPIIDPKRKDGSEKTDGQLYATLKAFKYTWFALGLSSRALDSMIRKIEAGIPITLQEYFGNKDRNSKGYKALNAMLNSKKLVYGDGKIYLKMSMFVLTEELTSYRDANNIVHPKPGKEDLHYLRLNMEAIDNAPNSETITLGVPLSASKMFNEKAISYESASSANQNLSNNIMDLDAKYLKLQQVNPSNKNEKISPRQIMTLIGSEQNDNIEVNFAGKTLKVGDVRRIFNQATSNRHLNKYLAVRNLMFNFENAQDELQKSIDLGRVTMNLEAFKDFALGALQASQTKTQMYEMFEGDYDLNTPMTWKQYQQLFLTYFSKDIFVEKEAGHTISLVSDWGYNIIRRATKVDTVTGEVLESEIVRDDEWLENRDKKEYEVLDVPQKGKLYTSPLRHNVMELNEDGTSTGVRYSEFLLPAHFAEIMNIKIGDPIPDVIAKMFAVRIPSQDKHSAVNLKLVGFLPVYYGSSGMFAEEMVSNMGADFDIDKLFAQIKEWYYDKTKGFVEYGNGIDGVNNKSETLLYEEYRRYMKEESKKRGTPVNLALRQYRKKNSKYKIIGDNRELTKTANEVWNDWNTWATKQEKGPQTLGWNELESRIQFARENRYPVNKNTGEFYDVYSFVDVKEETMNGALFQLGLPYSPKTYKEFKKKHKREPYTAPDSNISLDAKSILQGNSKMMNEDADGNQTGIANDPAVVDPLTDILKWMKNEIPAIRESLSEEGLDVDNLLGKIKAWINNHEGADNIGAVVLPNLVMNLLGEYNVKISDVKGVGQIVMNGVTYNNFSTAFAETSKGKFDKTKRTQFVISALITAMTDNAKERLAAYLGLNRDALAVVTNMTALGVPIKDSILMINHPTLKELYFRFYNPRTEEDAKSMTRLLSDALDAAPSEIKKRAEELPITTNDLVNQIEAFKYVKGTKQVINEVSPEERFELDAMEYKVLQTFANAHNIKQYTGYLTNLLTISAGLGQSTQKFDERDEAFEKLGIGKSDAEFAKGMKQKDGTIKQYPIDVRSIFEGKAFGKYKVIPWQSTVFKTYSELQQLLPKPFIWKTENFETITNLVINGLEQYKVTPEFKFGIQGSILSYLTAKAYIRHLESTGQVNKLASLRNGLIYDEFAEGKLTIKDIANTLLEENPDNYFIGRYVKLIETENAMNKDGINELQANTWNKLNDSTLVEIQRSLIELYTKDDMTRKDVEHLINYLFVKDGMNFARNTFLSVIPVQMLEEIFESIKPVHSLFLDKDAPASHYEKVFGPGVTLNDLANEINNSILESAKNAFYLRRLKRKVFPQPGIKEFVRDETDTLIREEDSVKRISATIGTHAALEQEMISGMFTAKKLGQKDYTISIGENNTQYTIKEVIKLDNKKIKNKAALAKLSRLSGIQSEYISARYGNIDHIKSGSYFTVLEKRSEPIDISKSKAFKTGPAFFDVKKGTLTLTMFPFIDIKDLTKGKKGKVKGRKMSLPEKLEKSRKYAVSQIKKLGIEAITIEEGGKKIQLFNLPTHTSLIVKDNVTGKPKQIFVKLETRIDPREKGKELDVVHDFNVDKGMILGHTAIYKVYEPLGSFNTTDIGAVFGPRSTHEDLVNMMAERDDRFKGKKWALEGEFDETKIQDGDLDMSKVNLTEEGGKDTNTNDDVDLSLIQNMSERPTTETDLDQLELALDDTQVVDETSLRTKAGNKTLDPTPNKLKALYEGLTDKDKKTLAAPWVENNGHNVKNAADFVALYEKNKDKLSLKDFEDYIKDCLK